MAFYKTVKSRNVAVETFNLNQLDNICLPIFMQVHKGP